MFVEVWFVIVICFYDEYDSAACRRLEVGWLWPQSGQKAKVVFIRKIPLFQKVGRLKSFFCDFIGKTGYPNRLHRKTKHREPNTRTGETKNVKTAV